MIPCRIVFTLVTPIGVGGVNLLALADNVHSLENLNLHYGSRVQLFHSIVTSLLHDS